MGQFYCVQYAVNIVWNNILYTVLVLKTYCNNYQEKRDIPAAKISIFFLFLFFYIGFSERLLSTYNAMGHMNCNFFSRYDVTLK